MPDTTTTLAALRTAVAAFVAERDWAQFHNAKDLAVSICIEAAELLEEFQWHDAAQVTAVSRDPEALEADAAGAGRYPGLLSVPEQRAGDRCQPGCPGQAGDRRAQVSGRGVSRPGAQTGTGRGIDAPQARTYRVALPCLPASAIAPALRRQ